MSQEKIRDDSREHGAEGARHDGPRGLQGPGALEEEPAQDHPLRVLSDPPAALAPQPYDRFRREAAVATARRWLEEGLVTPDQARAIAGLIADGEPGPEVLEGLVESGVLIRSQAAAVTRGQSSNGRAPAPLRAARPRGAAEPAGEGVGLRLPRPSIDAQELGVLLAAVAFVGLVWAVLSLLTDATATPRHPAGVALLDSVRLLAAVLALVGGRRMYRGVESGKVLVLTGLVIYALAGALLGLRTLADPVVILLLLSWALLYYLTAVSRFAPSWSEPAAAAPR